MQPTELIPPLIILAHENMIDTPSEVDEDGFESKGTFPFMEVTDDMNLDYFDHDIVLAPSGLLKLPHYEILKWLNREILSVSYMQKGLITIRNSGEF
ncbi:hypothetical protein SUGI_0491030 [Cryptomeria japonica]|nr:hypothetical protein SUGI_0491030 [Cryptomeria japonica]